MTPAEMARLEALEEVAEWSRQVRITIRGIDGQAKRRVHVSHFNGVTEEIIDGYELGTGLWHRLLGLLSSCPISEGTNASHGSGGQVQNNAGEQALDTVPSGRTSSRTLLAPAPAAPSTAGGQEAATMARVAPDAADPVPPATTNAAPKEGATPETDAVIVGGTIGQLALLEHARTLERRLSAVTKERDALMSMAMRERTQP